MKSKQITMMITLLVVTLAAYLIFSPADNPGSSENTGVGDEPLAGLEIGRIAAITLTTSEGEEITSLRIEKEAGRWTVAQRGGYPADTARIEGVVKNLIAMKILRRVPAGKSQLGRLHLDKPGAGKTAAAQIELFAADGKSIKVIHLGKELSAPGGEGRTSALGGGSYPDRRFVMLDAEPASAAVVDQTFSNANTDAADWINRTDFFEVNNVLSMAVDYAGTEVTNSWNLVRENTTTNWTLVAALEGEVLDQSKLSSFAQPLQSPTFNDVLTDAAANLSTNATRITLGTEDQFIYTLTLGEPNAEGEFPMQLAVAAKLAEKRARAEGEKPEDKAGRDLQWQSQQQQLKTRLALHQTFSGKHWTYLVPGYTVSDLLKKREELFAPKAAAPPLGPTLPFPPSSPLNPLQNPK
jgi:hypothetical protein